MRLRVAAVAWKLRPAKGDSDFFAHFYDLVSEAYDEGAQVVVFPELQLMELLPLAPDLEEQDAARFLVQFGEAIEGWVKRISDSSGLIIVGGSHFRETPKGIVNACAIGIPGHEVVIQEKNNLTAYERDEWNLLPGSGLARLPRKLGVTVCYDSEFPEASRVLAESGAMVQCVPAWTETEHGFHRVRWSCLARAIENQVYVVHSSLVGDIGYHPAAYSHGSAAILAPCIEPFPANGVLRETPMNEEGLVVVDLDLDLLHRIRRVGAVTNWQDRDAGTWNLADGPGYPEPDSDIRPNNFGNLN